MNEVGSGNTHACLDNVCNVRRVGPYRRLLCIDDLPVVVVSPNATVPNRTHAVTNQNFDIIAGLQPMITLLLLGKSTVGWERKGIVVGWGGGGF